jgi:Lsr2
MVAPKNVTACEASLIVATGTSSFGGISTRRKATALKLTLDSSEPLEDAMRVVGALYGVTLNVSAAEAGEAPSEARITSAQRTSEPAGTKAAIDGSPSAIKGARTRAPGRKTRARKATASATAQSSSPNNAEVRSWARQSGLTINDRGRIPASVLTAYRDSQSV